MIEISRPYEDYKDTELFWLNKIPAHWDWAYLSQISTEKKKKNTGLIEKNVLSLSYGRIIKKKNIDFGLVPKDYSGYQIVDSGDIILRLTDLQNDKKSLRTGLVKERGIITSAYTCLKTNQNPNYIHNVLHAYDTKKILYGMGGGVRQSIGYNEISKMRIPVPPRIEQEQIVKYLDSKLSKLNKLIKAKKKQINFLKEQINSMTNHAITDASNKQRLVNISQSIGKWIVRNKDQEYISIGLYNRGRGIFHKSPTLGSELGDSEFFEVEDDALIFSGQFAWEGAVALTSKKDEKCIASHRYYMIKSTEGTVINEYLWAFFQTKYGELLLNLNSRGAAGRNRPLNMRALLKEHIPLPPIELQNEIARVVQASFGFKRVVNQLEDLLIEYRDRLISDVVTGKVDVRNINVDDDIEQIEELEFDDEDIGVEEEVAVGEEV